MGLREQKKLKTRKHISDLATEMFLQRGYNDVTTAEIAELAEVSVPTLFKYFPTKESLVFDEDTDIEAWIVSIVIERQEGQRIIDALLSGGSSRIEKMPQKHKKNHNAFLDLIKQTPELNRYEKDMWMRHEQALANTILNESKEGLTKLEADVISRFVLDAFYRAISLAEPKDALEDMFEVLRNGWNH